MVDLPIGHLSQHMLTHIVLMNVSVPLLIVGLLPTLQRRWPGLWRSWPLSTAAQLLLLYVWHAPPVLSAAMASPALMLAMHVSLVVSAAWFWGTVLMAEPNGLWRSVLALLITGKLFCLLGALLVFAPRALYGAAAQVELPAVLVAQTLADQQFAGLVMLIACPLTYILAGVWLTARWFGAIGGSPVRA